MKRLKVCVLSLLAVLAVICFVGCSKDDDKNKNNNVNLYCETEGFIFNADGTGMAYEIEPEGDYYEQFTYTSTEIIWGNGDRQTYTLVENTLYIYGWGYRRVGSGSGIVGKYEDTYCEEE